MNKNLIANLFAFAALAMSSAACSQDETIESVVSKTEPRKEIEFHLDVKSRATDITLAELDTIWVYAHDKSKTVFEATPFIKDQYGSFKPAEKIYWPEETDSITFTAFWPSLEKIRTNPYEAKVPQVLLTMSSNERKFVYQPAACSLYNYDLITATKTLNEESAANGIPLNFTHAFAQVEFKAKIDPSAEHSVEIHGCSLFSAKTRGTYSFDTKTWAPMNETGNYIFAAPEEVLTVSEEAKSMTDKTGCIYMMPSTWNLANFADRDESTKTGTTLIVYGKVYDEENNVVYPKESDATYSTRLEDGTSTKIMSGIRDLTGLGKMRIQLGKGDLAIEAGRKYVFTVDFTNGVGYHAFGDKSKPMQPILNYGLKAQVTLEDWTLGSEYETVPNK